MRIVLSAFAFAPGEGSEAGVGWNYALALARAGHQVTVLTAPHQPDIIRAAVASDNTLSSIHVEFVGPKVPKSFIHKRWLLQFYYVVWQLWVLRAAKTLHRANSFDIAHAVTTSGIRFPCFLGSLGVPFFIGPLGGGETPPAGLLRGLALRHVLTEYVRIASTYLVRFDPLMLITFAQARLIFVRTEDTAGAIGTLFLHKIRRCFGLGIPTSAIVEAPRTDHRAPDGSFGILFVARLVYWKGGHLVLLAFARVAREESAARLTVVGRGPELRHLRLLADQLGIADRVIWRTGWIESSQLDRIYEENQVLLFPSLHEAGGTVVLEAMAKAMPVVCLDVGGPGQIVSPQFGTAVKTHGATAEVVVEYLGDAMLRLASRRDLYIGQSNAALKEAKMREWQRVVESVYRVISQAANAR